MGKSKRARSDKEYSEIQRLRRENDSLKKKIASIRKQLQRVDLDRYHNLKDIVAKHEREEELEQVESEQEILRKKWKCKKCNHGILEIILFTKLDQEWYYRQCTECDNRTRAQRFHEKVVGIFAKLGTK